MRQGGFMDIFPTRSSPDKLKDNKSQDKFNPVRRSSVYKFYILVV